MFWIIGIIIFYCIPTFFKFVISLIILTMKKWSHLTWCVLFYDFFMKKKKCFGEKKNRHCRKENKFQELPPFAKFVTQVLRSSRPQTFFKIGVLQKSAISTRKNLYWPLQTFFYRTPMVAASWFSQLKILFSAESGIYCWQPHQFLLQTPFERWVKD